MLNMKKTYKQLSIVNMQFDPFERIKRQKIYSNLNLLDNFVQSKEYHTCSLDLGGGSTQINFIPTDKVNESLINHSKYKFLL